MRHLLTAALALVALSPAARSQPAPEPFPSPQARQPREAKHLDFSSFDERLTAAEARIRELSVRVDEVSAKLDGRSGVAPTSAAPTALFGTYIDVTTGRPVQGYYYPRAGVALDCSSGSCVAVQSGYAEAVGACVGGNCSGGGRQGFFRRVLGR